MKQRQVVTKKKALAYRGADRAGKSRIRTELVELTGWHRDYARAALRDALTLKVVKPRLGRAPTYGPAVTKALVKCWAVLRAPAGKRLAPMLAVLVPMLRRDNELELSDAEAALLVRMSAATIARRLAGERFKLMSRGRSHTKPGTLLKSQIPIRTWADWDDAVPGFVEIDLVGHEGGNASGEHCFTLTVTDIATGWTVNRSVQNKAEKWVFEALMHLSRVFPNYLLPQQKLVFKQRNGAKVTKRYDTATTPHQRAIVDENVRKRPVIQMNAEFKRIKPAALSRHILALTGQLETLSLAKKPAAAKPPVNRAFNQ